jgi:hypothetical protein
MAKTGHKEQFNLFKLVFILSFPLKAQLRLLLFTGAFLPFSVTGRFISISVFYFENLIFSPDF